MHTPKPLSPAARWALVAGLWVVLLGLLVLAVRNFSLLASWAPGLLVNCLSACGLVIAFSLIAAAIHLTSDTVRGRYPY